MVTKNRSYKYFPYILIIVLGLILWFVKRNKQEDIPAKKEQRKSTQTGSDKTDDTFDNNERGLDRNQSEIILTKHAKCRMSCRNITLTEVKEILHDGKINYNKSKIDATPEYVLEGYSHEKQHIRIVVAPEDKALVLITCIDLDEDWDCNCK